MRKCVINQKPKIWLNVNILSYFPKLVWSNIELQPVALCKKSCETWALLATGTQQSWTEKGWKKTHKTIERQNFLFLILGRLVTIQALKNFLSPVSQKTKPIPFVFLIKAVDWLQLSYPIILNLFELLHLSSWRFSLICQILCTTDPISAKPWNLLPLRSKSTL